MSDITMCSGEGCSVAVLCHRHTATASEYQVYFVSPPGTDKDCDHYWPVKEERDAD